MLILSRVAIFLFFLFFAFSGQATNSPDIEKIDINTASLEDLIKIIHIGEVRAKELISLRPFSSLDDLTRIKGIGEKKLADIKKQGLAWVKIEKGSRAERRVENDLDEKKLAAITQQIPEEKLFNFFAFLVALAIAVFSGIIILLLKKKMKINYNKNI
jgi:hypothetical protein